MYRISSENLAPAWLGTELNDCRDSIEVKPLLVLYNGLKHGLEVEGFDWCEDVIDSNTDPFMLLVLLDALETMAGFDVMAPSTNIYLGAMSARVWNLFEWIPNV